MTFYKKSIRTKFLFGFILLSVFLIIISFIYFILLYQNNLKYEQEKLNIYLKFASSSINNDLNYIYNGLSALESLEDFKSLNLNKIKDIMDNFKNFKFIGNIMLTDSFGKIIIPSSNDQLDKLNLTDYPLYIMPLKEKKTVIEDNYIDGKLYITISCPIIKKDSVIAILIIFLKFNDKDIEIFNNIIDPDSFEWEIILTNKKGYLLYHTHKLINSNDLKELDYSLEPSVKNALLGNWKLKQIKINGKNFFSSSLVVSLSSWFIIVNVPQSLIFKKIIKIIAPTFSLLLFLIIFMMIIIWIWSNIFIKPLMDLTKAFIEYGEKGKTDLLHYKGNDEISSAFNSFNEMIIEKDKLDKELLSIIENDRKRIGSLIHEELESNLSEIYHHILIIKEEINKILNKDKLFILSYLDKIFYLLNKSINSTKLISNGLNPVSINNNIIQSLKELISNFKNSYNVNIQFKHDKDLIINEELIGINIYYIVLEALNNSIKYYGADKITITINQEINNLIIKIRNNGVRNIKAENKEMSVRIMYYLAKLINAEIIIKNTEKENEILCKIINNV